MPLAPGLPKKRYRVVWPGAGARAAGGVVSRQRGNMDSRSLLEAREIWYQAFFSGNTQLMEDIEAESFLVINEHGTQTKKEQLGAIALALSAGQWFPSGASKQDSSINIQQHGGFCVVSGKGRTLIGGSIKKAPVFFSEVWGHAAGSWQVLHLHYTPAQNG